jgi:hypothetical protein
MNNNGQKRKGTIINGYVWVFDAKVVVGLFSKIVFICKEHFNNTGYAIRYL